MGENLNKFFAENRERTLAFLRKRFTALSEPDLEDVYQNSSLALLENLLAGKYEEQNAGLNTYFLRICINQALKSVSKSGISVPLPENANLGGDGDYIDDKIDELINFIYEVEGYDEHERLRTENLVRAIMRELTEMCRNLLWGHICDGFSWGTLADMYGLANANSARTTANRCRNQFRDKFNEKNARIHG